MRWFIAAVAALVLASQADAQGTWPQRAVTLVVPFGAGGSADLTARILATHLQTKFGAPFVIDNKGGAGGSIGAGFVAKAAGWPLFFVICVLVAVPSLVLIAWLDRRGHFEALGPVKV